MKTCQTHRCFPGRQTRPALTLWFALFLVASLPVSYAPVAHATPQSDNDLTCRLAESAADRYATRTTRLHALALSGGGSRGAWGAGFLTGWQQTAEQAEDFDIVTGVSVGALLASHAFAGVYADQSGPDGEVIMGLERIFRELSNRDVRRKRAWLVWALFRSSAYSNDRLAKTLRKVISGGLLQRISDRVQKNHRLLCVATVNMRTGALVRWDLSQLAQHYAAAYGSADLTRAGQLLDLYRRVLLAATSIPGVFPATAIDLHETGLSVENTRSGDLHIDSGVRNQVVGPKVVESSTPTQRVPGTPFVADYSELLEKLEARRQADRAQEPDETEHLPQPVITMLINGPASVDTNWENDGLRIFPVFQIAVRSVQIILDETARDSRTELNAQATKFGALCRAMATPPVDLQPQDCKANRSNRRQTAPQSVSPLEFDCSGELFELGRQRYADFSWAACDKL